jgi:hypothetical protein
MNALDMQFRKDMKRLVIPSVLQMLLGNSFSLINTLMVRIRRYRDCHNGTVGQSTILRMLLTAIYGFGLHYAVLEDFINVKKAFNYVISSLILSSLYLCLCLC